MIHLQKWNKLHRLLIDLWNKFRALTFLHQHKWDHPLPNLRLEVRSKIGINWLYNMPKVWLKYTSCALAIHIRYVEKCIQILVGWQYGVQT